MKEAKVVETEREKAEQMDFQFWSAMYQFYVLGKTAPSDATCSSVKHTIPYCFVSTGRF